MPIVEVRKIKRDINGGILGGWERQRCDRHPRNSSPHSGLDRSLVGLGQCHNTLVHNTASIDTMDAAYARVGLAIVKGRWGNPGPALYLQRDS